MRVFPAILALASALLGAALTASGPGAPENSGRVPARRLVATPVRGFPSPGSKPEGLAWDGNNLWCNDFDDGGLYKLDVESGDVVVSYKGKGLPANPEGLAWDGQHLWTCDWHTGIIVKLRETPLGLEVLGTFQKPPNSGPTVGLEWDGASLWLACWPDVVQGLEFGQLYRLDPTTLAVQQKHTLPVYWIEDLAWDGRYLWSADWLFGVGFAIEPSTGDTLRTYRSPGPNPVGAAWDGNDLWVTDTTRDSIWALEIAAPDTTAVRAASWSRVKGLFRGR